MNGNERKWRWLRTWRHRSCGVARIFALRAQGVRKNSMRCECETRTPITRQDWPDGLYERTAGAWQGAPLQREDQGEYEQRLEID
jgi:hypothetical protein